MARPAAPERGLAARCCRNIAVGPPRLRPCRPSRPGRCTDGELVSHVGLFLRDRTWDGREVHVGGIGGVATADGSAASASPAPQ